MGLRLLFNPFRTSAKNHLPKLNRDEVANFRLIFPCRARDYRIRV